MKIFYAKGASPGVGAGRTRNALMTANTRFTSINRGFVAVKTGAKVLQIFTRFDLL
jgi:hypothetical protein